ncbi:hypothetical protein C8R42DRAFT_728632, partial [Lentinula raphanica]
MPRIVCTRANCPQPSSGSSTQAHEKNYHSVKHTVFYDGIKTTIHRREDGKLPCPCGSEVHARYNFQKWSNLNRQLPHPGSESSPYPDEPTTHDAAAPYPDSIQSRPEAFAASPAPPLVETSQANQSLRATTRNPEESCQDDPSADVDMPPEPIPTLPQTPAETVAYLARFNIAVEPTCLLTICTECHSLVEHVHIQTHQRRLHFRGLNLPAENRLPSNAIIQSLLSSLGAHQPRPIPEGGIPCPPGVNTVQGYKCSIPGCPPMVYGAERTFRKHWSLHHPTLAVHDRHSTRVQCFPLNTQHHDGTYIEAIPATISNAPSSAMQHIHASAENCDLRSHTQLFSVSTNARRKGAVFAQSRWDLAIDGINCRQVANTSSKAVYDILPGLERLPVVCRDYYQYVTDRIPQLSILVRRHILSHSPSNIKNKPFSRPQELGTIDKDSDYVARFIAFLVSHHHKPIDKFPVPLHPELGAQLEELVNQLQEKERSTESFKDLIHQTVWLIISRP